MGTELKGARKQELEESRSLHVWKFGGSSVGSAQAIERTAGIIHRQHLEGTPLIIVTSAMLGATNRLITICERIDEKADDEVLKRELDALFDMHLTATTELRLDPRRRADVKDVLRHIFLTLHDEVYERVELTPEKMDKIHSFGERLCAPIVSTKLQELGLDSVPLDSSNVIITDDNFGEATPFFEETAENASKVLMPLISEGTIPVVTGYFGSTRNGKIALFGRGGSDFTASILGKVLTAQEIWIWTDVDGVYNGDPRRDPNAQLYERLSYEQADELAKQGAKVLYQRTLEPLFDTDIVLRVKNSFNPSAEGTKISRGSI